MRNATIKVKCGPGFLEEVSEIITGLTGLEHIFLYDFLLDVQDKASHALSVARDRVNDPSVIVSTEFSMRCPYIIKYYAPFLMLHSVNSMTDFYMLMENISTLPDDKFV